jgi:uncharacterized protein YqjF (DUF2071 family)
MIDRLSIRTRPPGWPIMYQSWGKLLFMHWSIAAELLRPVIAPQLNIDTFEGRAWISITPFTLWGIRPIFLPPLPVLSTSHELNVRTYVHVDGVPGVWFLSLEASNALAVWLARLVYGLPYFRAHMQLEEHHSVLHFTSTRMHPGAPAAQFEAFWTGGDVLPPAAPGSLDSFLIERYCLYAARGGQLYRARIFHDPWSLCRVERLSFASTILESHDLPTPGEAPLLHAQARPLRVGIWRAERV